MEYAYDAAHRLSHCIQPNSQRDSYEFDLANNLVKQPGLGNVSLQSGNRLNTANDEKFAYNDRNHISERTSHRGTIKYEYDSRDQLIRAELPTGLWEADYDAMGRRVRKTFNGQTTQYLWNTDQLAGEISPDGRLILYVYADPLALTPMLFIEYESVDAETSTGKRYFVLSDQIGTPICIENSFGNVVWQAKIEPFGETKLSTDNQIEFHFRFPGHYWDEDVTLNNNRFRFYDPILGRYIQSDPLGIAGNSNVHAYCVNPLNFVDVRGLTCPHCERHGIADQDCPENHKDTEVVYVHVNDEGVVVYIGITNAPERRAGEHASDPTKTGTTMIVVSPPVSHDDARNIESLAIRARLDAAGVDRNASVADQLHSAGLDNLNRGRTDDRRAEAPGTAAGIGNTGFTDEAFDLTNGGTRL